MHTHWQPFPSTRWLGPINHQLTADAPTKKIPAPVEGNNQASVANGASPKGKPTCHSRPTCRESVHSAWYAAVPWVAWGRDSSWGIQHLGWAGVTLYLVCQWCWLANSPLWYTVTHIGTPTYARASVVTCESPPRPLPAPTQEGGGGGNIPHDKPHAPAGDWPGT